MAKKNSANGRGEFTEYIELKYVQIPREVWKKLYIDFSFVPDHVRYLALGYYFNHFMTNKGYEELKVIDSQAYMICSALDAATEITQNNARWECFDNFYKGRLDIDYEAAFDEYLKEKRDKKKEQNQIQYQRRKQQVDWGERLKEEQEKQDKLTKQYIEEYSEDIKKL